jgi:hypothetical protein
LVLIDYDLEVAEGAIDGELLLVVVVEAEVIPTGAAFIL